MEESCFQYCFCGYYEPDTSNLTTPKELTDTVLRRQNAVIQPLTCTFSENVSTTHPIVVSNDGVYYINKNKELFFHKISFTNSLVEDKKITYKTSLNDVSSIQLLGNNICSKLFILYLVNGNQQCVAINDHDDMQPVQFDVRVFQMGIGRRISILTTEENTIFKLDQFYSNLSALHLPTNIRVSSISCGAEHAIILTEDHKVWTVGNGSRAQLGTNAQLGTSDLSTGILTCVQALFPMKIIAISAGGWHNIVLSESGDIYGWGWNESGQVGAINGIDIPNDNLIESEENFPKLIFVPTLVDTPIDEQYVKISTGLRHSAAITANGALFTWGWNGYGQLGHRDQVNRIKPCLVNYYKEMNLVVTDIFCGEWCMLVKCLKEINTGTEKCF